MARAIAALLAVLLTSTIAAPLTCAGWENSPEGRRECGRRADHAGCPDQKAADNCCAAHEQSRQLTPALSPAPLPSPMSVVALPVLAFDPATPDRTAAILHDAILAAGLHGPPHPLILPLRI